MDFNKLNKIIFATNPSYVGGGGLLFCFPMFRLSFFTRSSLFKEYTRFNSGMVRSRFVLSKFGNVKGVSEEIVSKTSFHEGKTRNNIFNERIGFKIVCSYLCHLYPNKIEARVYSPESDLSLGYL